jgi:hypothetical protein
MWRFGKKIFLVERTSKTIPFVYFDLEEIKMKPRTFYLLMGAAFLLSIVVMAGHDDGDRLPSIMCLLPILMDLRK